MDITKLSDKELKLLQKKTKIEIGKYNNYQLAKKVQLNSAYGAMGNQYFRFYDIRLAEAVTLSGQLVIQWIAQDVNEYLNKVLDTDNQDYIVAIDTDSIYVCLENLINKIMPDETDTDKVIDYLDKVCEKKITDIIDDSCARLGEYLNVYDQKMVMKREALSDKAIWTAKKRYVMNVYDLEGVRYETPDLKIINIHNITFLCCPNSFI
jgi:DNA polymerase elongation subunit (family B)